MSIYYRGTDGAYAVAYRKKAVNSVSAGEELYLGRVVDREMGIYYTKERGLYTYHDETGEYGEIPEGCPVPEQYQAPKKSADPNPDSAPKKNILPDRRHRALDFGDAYLLHTFLRGTGMMDVLDSLSCPYKDTLRTMVLFYACSDLALCDVSQWYKGSLAKLLYPHACLTEQGVRFLLGSIGAPEELQKVQKAWSAFLLTQYGPDWNELRDLRVLPRGVQEPPRGQDGPGTPGSHEVRGVFLVQQNTGLPLFYWTCPDSAPDGPGLSRILLQASALGAPVDACHLELDPHPVNTLEVLSSVRHRSSPNYLTRLRPDNGEFQAVVRKELPKIWENGNLVFWEGRQCCLTEKKVFLGTEHAVPAWMYLVLDCDPLPMDLWNLLDRAQGRPLSREETLLVLCSGRVQGWLSNREHTQEELLADCAPRETERLLARAFANSDRLLPRRDWSDAELQGHLLLSYLAFCAVSLLRLHLRSADLPQGFRLEWMRGQKASVQGRLLQVEKPDPECGKVYKALRIPCPESLQIGEGGLSALPAEQKSSAKPAQSRKKQGGSKGSRGKATSAQGTAQDPAAEAEPKRKPGRPEGSKNKSTLDREAKQKQEADRAAKALAARQAAEEQAKETAADSTAEVPAKPAQEVRP